MRRSLVWAATALGLVLLLPSAASADSQKDGVLAWLALYDRAFSEKKLDVLATFYASDATIVSEGAVARGWEEYRDSHLLPELDGLDDLTFSHVRPSPKLLGEERVACVVSEFLVRARRAGRDVDMLGVETLILVRDARTGWKIQHAHSSPHLVVP